MNMPDWEIVSGYKSVNNYANWDAWHDWRGRGTMPKRFGIPDIEIEAGRGRVLTAAIMDSGGRRITSETGTVFHLCTL